MEEKLQLMDEVSRIRAASLANEDPSFTRDVQPSQFSMTIQPYIQDTQERDGGPRGQSTFSWMGSVSSLTSAVTSATSHWASSLAGSIRSRIWPDVNVTRASQLAAVYAAAANSYYHRGMSYFLLRYVE